MGRVRRKIKSIDTYETVSHLWTHLKTFTASEESPAVLARGKPMNPTGRSR